MSPEDTASQLDCLDLESIAALLDRQLPESEREAALKHLRACERCYEILTLASRTINETAGEKAGEIVELPTKGTSRRWWSAAAMLATAAILTVAVATRFTSSIDPLTAASLLGSPERPADLAANYYSGNGWSRTRGAISFLSPTQRAFRLGVRTVNLEAALLAHDANSARGLLLELSTLVTDLPHAAPVLSLYRQLDARLGSDSPTELRDASTQAAHLAREATQSERLHFDFGQWAEAGRLAALLQNRHFFRRPEIREFAEAPALDATDSALLEPLLVVRQELGSDLDAGDMPALERALTQIVKNGGG